MACAFKVGSGAFLLSAKLWQVIMVARSCDIVVEDLRFSLSLECKPYLFEHYFRRG